MLLTDYLGSSGALQPSFNAFSFRGKRSIIFVLCGSPQPPLLLATPVHTEIKTVLGPSVILPSDPQIAGHGSSTSYENEPKPE